MSIDRHAGETGEFDTAGVLILTLLVWGVLEFGWRLYDSRITVRNPIQWDDFEK